MHPDCSIPLTTSYDPRNSCRNNMLHLFFFSHPTEEVGAFDGGRGIPPLKIDYRSLAYPPDHHIRSDLANKSISSESVWGALKLWALLSDSYNDLTSYH